MSEASKPVEEQQLPIRKISDKLVDSITDKPWLEIVQETKTQLKMEKTAASLKKELSIESERASKKVLIKVSSSCETIDFLIKNAEQKLKKEGDEEQKESIIKEVEYLKGVKENCLSVNGIVEELDKKISLSLPKKRVHHRYMNFFGISVFKFQMQLSDTFRCSVIEASFHCDPDYQFLCFVPAPEYVARLTEFSHQLLDMYSEEPRMNNFAFNKTRRGLHISLIYEDDGRSQFNMRRKKTLY